MKAGHSLKKVLVLHKVLPPYRKAIYNGLADHYDVTVLHSGSPTVRAEDNYREVIVPARAMGPFVLQQQVATTLASCNADAVVAMLDLRWPAQLLPILARRNRHARWIFWGPGYGRSGLANRVRDWLFLRRADALLLYGAAHVDTFVRRGTPRDRIFVAHNTIHVTKHRDFSAERKSSLLFVGRLQKRKRLDLLIDTFAKVADALPRDTTLEIVGDMPRSSEAGGWDAFKLDLETRSRLQQKAVAAGVGDRVVFHAGTQNAEDLAKLFARAYAYVSPGHVGLGVLHSFAYGVPVITCRGRYPRHGAEVENLKDGGNSLLFDSDAELGDALCAICNTPGLHARLGANAYRHYSTARTLDSMLNGLRRAIEG